MSWSPLLALQTTLPDQCSPENEFLRQLSSTLGTCIPTPLALISTLFGICSIVAWLFAQLPQIYKNWSLQSTSGLSIFFLVEWCLGDVSNLLGALFTHQASWQVAIGAYYVFVDLALVAQWVWYERLRHGHPILRMRKSRAARDGEVPSGSNQDMEHVTLQGGPALGTHDDKAHNTGQQPAPTRPKVIFRAPTFQAAAEAESSSPGPGGPSVSPNKKSIYRVGSSPSQLPMPSPRTILTIACLIAVVAGSPIDRAPEESLQYGSSRVTEVELTPLEQAGTILAWISTLLYLGSRLPQLIKNWRRKSVAGLSPHLFMAAFCGNLFYSSALLTNPNAWNDFGPYGGGGWVGADGNDRVQWVLAALPFFLGAAGVLVMDASVGIQFLIYSDAEEKLIVVDHDTDGGEAGAPPQWHWRRVSGWMRGWVPSITSDRGAETEALIRQENTRHGDGYGTL